MTRILTNVDSLVAFNNLGKANNQLGVTLTRLSTGLRVNSGKDDPAGLISGEYLRQEISSTKSAIANNGRANNVISTADAALTQIGSLLDDVRGIITTSANKGVLSQEEVEANQAAVDSAVRSVDRIAATTQFAGKKLLDGSLGFKLSGLTRFDSATATFTDVKVNLANFNAAGSAIAVSVTLVTVAEQATVAVSAATAGSDSTIEVIGNKGSAIINIANGQSVAAAINASTDVTGVTATGTTVSSQEYGSNAFVKIKNISGSVLGTSEVNDTGSDAGVLINGNAASAKGLVASYKSANLEVDVTFAAGIAAGTNTSFDITGGGAQFQLGREINQANQANIGIQSFASSTLGHVSNADGNRTLASIVTGGSNSLLNNKSAVAADIIKEAITQVGSARARLGAFQKNTIEANVASLQVSLENLSAARSSVVDADFAQETAELTRSQILVQAGTSVLSIANSRPQSVLSLLQR